MVMQRLLPHTSFDEDQFQDPQTPLWTHSRSPSSSSSAFLASARIPSSFDSPDEVQQDLWPNPFFKSKKKGLFGMLASAIGNIISGEPEEEKAPSPADLGPLTLKAQQSASRASEAAAAAKRAAELSLVREHGVVGATKEAERSWTATLQAAKVAEAQRTVGHKLHALRQDRQNAFRLLSDAIGEAQQATLPETPAYSRSRMLRDSRHRLEEVDKLLPRIQDELLEVRAAQDHLDKKLEATLPPHGMGLFPKPDPIVAVTPLPDAPQLPEAELQDLALGPSLPQTFAS
eukprot:TRINITY_DN111480_c0_g1_i1.p1 TRINITY_DN111480_c0_g1~~TRINITY_DN111480_c0_g1_i1.p1  ORF type:complete len:309 (+),score=78.31 TRINITY_DN111480_c0_g1_i1:64-927(+)